MMITVQGDNFWVQMMVDYKSQIYTLSNAISTLFIHTLSENVYLIGNIINFYGWNNKFIKIGKAMISNK